jgi:streptomycin 6-kinase
MKEYEKYYTMWGLIPDGNPIITQTSKLFPVLYKQMPAMFKIALVSEEQSGGQLMLWWEGRGAAPILAHTDNVLLMERATGEQSLSKMAKQNQDNEASRIICAVVAKLHCVNNKPLPLTLVPLSNWFSALDAASVRYGGVLKHAATTAHELLKTPQDRVVLHGDIHHENILDFGKKGWLAIDPKGLLGERGFDYANIFCNPEMGIATKPGRL